MVLNHFEHLLCILCQARISKCRSWSHGSVPPRGNLTPSVSSGSRDTLEDPWPETARGSWNSWKLPEALSGGRGERRRGREGAESRRPSAACVCAGSFVFACAGLSAVLVSVCAPDAVFTSCFRALVCGFVWCLPRSLGLYAAKGGLVLWPGLASR